MKHTRRKVRNQVLGPRALAVISCALALLAAQPLVGSTSKGRETVASVKVAGEKFEARQLQVNVATASEKVSGVRRQDRPGSWSPARPSLHILATVEMLHRLLAFELRPIERQVVPALVLAALPVSFELVIAPPYRAPVTDVSDVATLPHEQRFAIEQCLLAPPVA